MMIYKTGEKPGVGRYRCLKCGEVIRLDQSTDTLPPCPVCAAVQWTRVS